MKLIKVKDSEIIKGRDVTPQCDAAKIIHLLKHRFAINLGDDFPAIGFKSEAFSLFVKNPPSPIVAIEAHEHTCLCCGCISEEIVLSIWTEDGNQYQISDSTEITMLINISIVD